MAATRSRRSSFFAPRTKRRKVDPPTSSASSAEQHQHQEEKREEKEEEKEETENDVHTDEPAASSVLTSSPFPPGQVALSPSLLSSSSSSSATSSVPVIVGTAAWSIPRASAPHFPGSGTHLARYSTVLTGVEINSSFYNHHQPSTYRKWAATTPHTFRFAVKLHRDFTHTHRLNLATTTELRTVIAGLRELGDKLAVLLVQLPPSLAFEREVVEAFFGRLRSVWDGVVVVEPRHASWASEEATAVLTSASVGRVIADPDRCPASVVATCPVVYYRLHGSPIMYKSEYSDEALDAWVARMSVQRSAGKQVWCMFDNTALGAATENAVSLMRKADAMCSASQVNASSSNSADTAAAVDPSSASSAVASPP